MRARAVGRSTSSAPNCFAVFIFHIHAFRAGGVALVIGIESPVWRGERQLAVASGGEIACRAQVCDDRQGCGGRLRGDVFGYENT